jgi:hypothetical protein
MGFQGRLAYSDCGQNPGGDVTKMYVLLIFGADAETIGTATIAAHTDEEARDKAATIAARYAQADGYQIWRDAQKCFSTFPDHDPGPMALVAARAALSRK